MDKPLLSQEISLLHATFCAALVIPGRVRVLQALAPRPRTRAELAADVGLSQAVVADHLQVLSDCGLVRATGSTEGASYTLAEPRAVEALHLLHTVRRDASLRDKRT
jgi:DNA-binding transcriptional ArsR family regulator